MSFDFQVLPYYTLFMVPPIQRHLGLLQMKLLQTFVNKFLCENTFLLFLSENLGEKLLHHIVSIIFDLHEIAKLFS